MLLKLFRALNEKKPQLREFDPTTIQRIREGAYLTKLIAETQVAARKCEFFASNAVDSEVRQAFEEEARVLRDGARTLQQYYESMTAE